MRHELQSWLSQHCSVDPGTVLGALLLRRDDGLHVGANWPEGKSMPANLAQVGAAAVTRRKAVTLAAKTAGGTEALEVLGHPLEVDGTVIGAVVAVLRAPKPLPAAVRNALGQHAKSFASLAPQPPANPAPAEAATPPSSPATVPAAVPAAADPALAARVLQLLQTTFSQRDWQANATALAATLAHELACSRVAVGFRHGIATQVVACSDGGPVDPQRGVNQDTAAAMDEAIDDGLTLVHPQPPEAPPRIGVAHARLARRQGAQHLCSVPLVDGQRVVGALLLERTEDPGFDPDTLALLETVSRLAGPWLALQRRAARPWPLRAWRSLRGTVRVLQKPGRGRYKLAALGLGALLGALTWVPTQREVHGTARLEGTIQRVLAAPGDGYLKQVMVRPGDTVSAGQVLLEFAGDDLQIERARLLAEWAGAQAAAADAMSKHDRSQWAIQNAKAGELEAQLALADQRIDRAQMKAPFDAVVISGDLSHALGAPVRKGDALLTLAPRDGFRAIVEVEDGDIGQVREGQTGSMVLTAQPDRALSLRVQRITPLATQVDGRNVFEIEVAVASQAAQAPQDLRPGMRGIARLHIGDAPLALAWTRDVSAWLRLTAWRWIG